MSSRLVVVGEDNPHGPPEMALYHLPRHAAGDRLRRIMGLDDVAYAALEKVNLCDRRWDHKVAAARAREILGGGPVRVVALGAKVRRAFGGLNAFQMAAREGFSVLGLPHPSGRCQVWNEPENHQRARAALAVFAPEIAWGSGGR